MQEKPKFNPLLIGAGALIVVIVIVFMVMRGGGSVTGERPANDVSSMIPKPTETTPPPPQGMPVPAMMGSRGRK